jgi:hypothetical protein
MPVEMDPDSNAGGSLDFLNVSTTVGKHSVNHEGDVLLVQAMFYEVLPYVYGVPRNGLPYPTGTYDKNTEYRILQYQEKSSISRRVKIWKDGFINRAEGAHVPGKKRVWTITYMNEDLYYAYASRGYYGNYIQWLIDEYPALNYYLDQYA